MKAVTLTADEIAKLMCKSTMHLNLGYGCGYGYGYKSILYPRLGFIDYTYKGARAKEEGCASRRVWLVDGAQHVSIEEAIEALAKEPALTDDEARALALLRDEPEDLRDFERRVEEAFGIPPTPPGEIANHNHADDAVMGITAKDFARLGRRAVPPRYEGDKNAWVPTIERRKI